MDFEKLDEKAILSWRIRRIISLIFIIITVGGLLLIINNIGLDNKYK